MDILGNAAEMQQLALEALEALEAANRAGHGSAIDTMLSLLTSQEEDVIRHRHGLGRDRLRTLREIGDVMGLSGQRVSQIEHKARRRLSWFVRMVGPVGSPAVRRYAIEKREERAVAQRVRCEQVANEAAASAQRIAAKAERDDMRRAKARTRAWQRKIDTALAERDRRASAIELLTDRISHIERRGWLARHFLPHDFVLVRLRAALVSLETEMDEVDASIERLRAAPPT
ncbi:sigma factor-like helix-turn-helix DNA-binding protein [Sphingomonas sp. YL-JM2C]